MSVLLYILAAGILGVIGQVTMKRGLASIGPILLDPATLPNTVLSLSLNPLVVLGLLITVSGTFFWLITLSRIDLSFAYPFASLNYVFVLAASWLLLDESISLIRLLGVVAICTGVCLVMRTPRQSRPSAAKTVPLAPEVPEHLLIPAGELPRHADIIAFRRRPT